MVDAKDDVVRRALALDEGLTFRAVERKAIAMMVLSALPCAPLVGET